jgi:hypothetical protein
MTVLHSSPEPLLNMGESSLNEDLIDDYDEEDEVISTTYSITSYGADYPVDSIVKRMQQNDIVVPTYCMDLEPNQQTIGFQREFVWKKSQCDRFIESLLLGLPVPGIFLVKESSGKLLVLDGQQRLRTLSGFVEGILQGKEYVLDHVQEKWKGKRYKTLEPEDRRRLDDSIIHATIVRQDEPAEDQSSIYLIFERLNSSGTVLQPQEIRVALYHGEYASLLSRLNENTYWRELYGRKSARLKDLELILRFFSLYYRASAYKKPMKEFLNKSMANNKNLTKYTGDELTTLFENVVTLIHDSIGKRAFRLKNAVNAALVDSLMVGVASRLSSGPIENPILIEEHYRKLLHDQSYLKAVSSGTADEDSVTMRLSLAKKVFAEVE